MRGKAKLTGLKNFLIETENTICDSIFELNESFEIKLTEISQKTIEQYMNFFIQVLHKQTIC